MPKCRDNGGGTVFAFPKGSTALTAASRWSVWQLSRPAFAARADSGLVKTEPGCLGEGGDSGLLKTELLEPLLGGAACCENGRN